MGPYSRQEPALIPESMDQGKRALFQFFQSLFHGPALPPPRGLVFPS